MPQFYTFVRIYGTMITVKLREGMAEYRRRTGERLTYAKLERLTGISESTLRAIGSKLGYHPTLANLEKLCLALDVTPGFLLEIIDKPPNKKAKGKPKAKKKKKTKPKKS